jgi:hypothetical protein
MKDYLILSLLLCLFINYAFAELRLEDGLNDLDRLVNCLNSEECKETLKKKIEDFPEKELKQKFYEMLVNYKPQLEKTQAEIKEFEEVKNNYTNVTKELEIAISKAEVIVDETRAITEQTKTILEANLRNLKKSENGLNLLAGLSFVSGVISLGFALTRSNDLTGQDDLLKNLSFALAATYGAAGVVYSYLAWQSKNQREQYQEK